MADIHVRLIRPIRCSTMQYDADWDQYRSYQEFWNAEAACCCLYQNLQQNIAAIVVLMIIIIEIEIDFL